MATEQAQAFQEQVEEESIRRKPRIPPGYVFIAPALFVLGVVSVYPVLYSLVLSLFDWRWDSEYNFVGLENYTRLLGDPDFWAVIGNTFYFAIAAVIVEMVLGLALAVVVNRLGFGASIIRTLLLVPLLVPGIVVSLMWKILLDPLDGVINWALGTVGLPKPLWLGSADTVIPGIVLIDTWWQTAFVFIILAAALKSLPDEPLEAAKVDGANGWQTFWHVTLPLLRPALLTVIIFRTIDTLKVFDIIFGTTGGGPNRASEAAQTLAYRTAFDFLEMSRSMTVMVIFSAVILVICILYVVFGERRTEA